MEDRRSENRRISCIPAHVERDPDAQHLALIHDVSTKGALLFTRTRLEVGDPVHLALYLLPEHEPPRPVSGHVVRVLRRAIERSDVWQWEVGVEFDEPIDQYSKEIEDLCQRQREVGVLKG